MSIVGIFIAFFSIVVLVLICYLVLDTYYEYHPNQMFKKHIKRVKQGKYRVERSEYFFDVKTGWNKGVRFMKSDQNSKEKDNIQIQVRCTSEISAEFTYSAQTGKITSFDCIDDFAKKLEIESFMKELHVYLSIIISKEYNKPSDKEKLKDEIEKAIIPTLLFDKSI